MTGMLMSSRIIWKWELPWSFTFSRASKPFSACTILNFGWRSVFAARRMKDSSFTRRRFGLSIWGTLIAAKFSLTEYWEELELFLSIISFRWLGLGPKDSIRRTSNLSLVFTRFVLAVSEISNCVPSFTSLTTLTEPFICLINLWQILSPSPTPPLFMWECSLNLLKSINNFDYCSCVIPIP